MVNTIESKHDFEFPLFYFSLRGREHKERFSLTLFLSVSLSLSQQRTHHPIIFPPSLRPLSNCVQRQHSAPPPFYRTPSHALLFTPSGRKKMLTSKRIKQIIPATPVWKHRSDREKERVTKSYIDK